MDEKNPLSEQAAMSQGSTQPFPLGADPMAQSMSALAGMDPAALSFPWLPDWWRCSRMSPISGRYEGNMTAPTAGRQLLDLRVDIDPRHRNSPVMNRLSGDLYDVHVISIPGRPVLTSRVYRESWIVDAPAMKWSRCEVQVEGTVRYWKGTHPPTTIRVRIPWSGFKPIGPAEVVFTQAGGLVMSFSCARKSDCFRDVKLEIDVVESASQGFVLPAYDTHAHPSRPADVPRRMLTVEEVFREAGICLTMRPGRSIVTDSAPEFVSWSVTELHDRMETYFSEFSSGWPKWEMWGLLAGAFDDPDTGGIMFDAAEVYGGSGEPPERQGFAVFRNHDWFKSLPQGTPANDDEAEALRKFLYTWVHEAGHAFNFLHSWDKNRPDALSWMNYDWRYDNRNPSSDFWSNFYFRFDDEELIHIRHGDRASVIMGGDPWASGGHIEGPPGAEHLWAPPGALSSVLGGAPLELLVRSKEYFQFLEPVTVELRLRNTLDDLPLQMDTHLSPEYGGVIIYIRRPDGRIVEYAPVMCKLSNPAMQTLEPSSTAVVGADRYSENVFLSYGQYGFYLDEPGEYLVRALYQGTGDVLVPSNVHRLRVGYPTSKQEDRDAQDFFTYPVGMSLYLGGSPSPHLTRGMDVLRDVAARYQDSLVGAKAAVAVANCVAQPFYRVPKDGNKIVKYQAGDPGEAVKLTEAALDLHRREKTKALNVGYHQLVRSRAAWLLSMDNERGATEEVQILHDDLAQRDVNPSVLNEIERFAASISHKG